MTKRDMVVHGLPQSENQPNLPLVKVTRSSKKECKVSVLGLVCECLVSDHYKDVFVERNGGTYAAMSVEMVAQCVVS